MTTLNNVTKESLPDVEIKLIKNPISTIYPICCGIDVHKKTIVACIILTDNDGQFYSMKQTFFTFTKDIFRLREWLDENACPVAAIESTSVYWRPVHNVLEDHIEVVLVNARHAKGMPGRKTDIKDSEWLAVLLNKGLLNKSFIPGKEQRQWRELFALRKGYNKELTNAKRRVHKLFETANIKISSVVTDLFGVTGHNLIDLLLSGKQITREAVRKCAKGSLREKVNELYDSIEGFFEEHHRFQLNLLMQSIAYNEQTMAEIEKRLFKLTAKHEDLFIILDPMPGVNRIGFLGIISYIGTTMDEFKTVANIVSWAGLCPGSNESAGKRRSTKSPVHKHQFKSFMIELAWAAVKKKDSFYKEKFHRLKSRLGAKKAIVAIAAKMLKAIYNIIKERVPYKELGADYLTEKQKQSKFSYLQKQAQLLGYELVAQN